MINRLVTWARLLFFTNLTVTIVITILYLFDIMIPPINGVALPDPLVMLIGYVLALLFWLLLDRTRVLDNTAWLAQAYDNRGLRPLDAGLVVFAALMVALAWRMGFASLAILATGLLLAASGLLGLWQLRAPYGAEIVDVLIAEDNAPAGGEQPPG